ncbi:MAG: LicD family protein [Tannerella sp.]|jgi:lipopolysaccharide cholinephosphotransferase|nr:LicD family protein [Tannerella sp.]
MKPIDIDECHTILLSIAAEFDRICRKHQIPYYMLGGTMLGAVRHRGFIPWDDDMDFGVPRKHFARLVEMLSEELPAHMRVLTLNNRGFIVANYIKIDDRHTYVADYWLNQDTKIGVNIDIFPLDEGLRSGLQTRLFVSYILFLLTIKDFICIDPDKRRGVKKIFARMLRFLFLHKTGKLLKYIDRCIVRHTFRDSAFQINYYGKWREKEVVSKKIFGEPKAYEFRGCPFYGVEDADAYLTQLYGNYMQLPPEREQTAHATERYMTEQLDY